MEDRVARIIDHEFRHPALLRQALTHPSCKCQMPGIDDYQRLEHVGDAVLNLIAAKLAYTVLPNKQEGGLTVARSRIVSNAALARVGKKLKFVEAVRFGDSVKKSGSPKVAADVTEAVLGAVFIDGGYEAAKRVFDRSYAPILLRKPKPGVVVYENPKSALQERLQKKHKAVPTYKTDRRAGGSDHAPKFRSKVYFNGIHLGCGKGGNKRESEVAAARAALKKLDAGDEWLSPEPTNPVDYADDADYAHIDPSMLLGNEA